jgi:hypothetical protein
MEKSKFSLPVVIALIVGLLVGYSFGAIVYRNDSSGDVTKLDESLETEENNEEGIITAGAGEEKVLGVPGEVSFSVANQTAGSQVVIAEASVDRVTWLAVRDYAESKIGNVLGAKRLPAGAHTDVAVELLRPTIAGQSYAVVAFYDDGDLAFDHKVDAAVMEGDMIILKTFLVQ